MSQLADLVQRYYDIVNRRDYATYDRLFTPDCTIQAPGVELSGIEGARAFDKVWMGAIADGQIINLHKTATGNIVMCENRIRGHHTAPLVTADGTLPPSGRLFDEPYMAVFEFQGERIKRQTLHFDRLQVLKVLGPNPNANIEVVQSLYAAYGRGDMAGVLALVADDVTWGIDSIAAGEVAPYGIQRGKAAVEAFFAAWAASADFHVFDPHDFVSVGNGVHNMLAYELTVKSTGKRLKNLSPQHWTVSDGKITQWRGYEDTAATRDAFRK
jgi:ketosteroid isomerase-like protein